MVIIGQDIGSARLEFYLAAITWSARFNKEGGEIVGAKVKNV